MYFGCMHGVSIHQHSRRRPEKPTSMSVYRAGFYTTGGCTRCSAILITETTRCQILAAYVATVRTNWAEHDNSSHPSVCHNNDEGQALKVRILPKGVGTYMTMQLSSVTELSCSRSSSESASLTAPTDDPSALSQSSDVSVTRSHTTTVATPIMGIFISQFQAMIARWCQVHWANKVRGKQILHRHDLN